MAKLTLSNVSNFADNSTAVTTTTANNDAIEAFAETVLSRDGTAPNTMAANLDMNSNRVINLAAPVSGSDAARKADVDAIVAAGLPDQTGNSGEFLTTDGTSASWAAVIDEKTKVSANDTVSGYLEDKILASGLAGLSTQNDGANETRTIDVPIASQAEAEAGVINTKAMTPLRVAQAVAALAPSANIQTLLDGISTTQGALLYYNGTDWVALSPGTSGHFLKSNGAGSNPSYASVSTPVLVQTVYAADTTVRSTTSTSATDSLSSITITGVTSGNRVRVRAVVSASHSAGGVDIVYQIRRDTTDITPGGLTRLNAHRPPGTADLEGIALSVEDTGHSGGSITYRLYWWTGSGTAYLGRSGGSAATTAPSVIWTVEEYTP